MRAISTLSLEWGTSTFCWRALMALRTRVKKSETGSVKLMLYFSSKRHPLASRALAPALDRRCGKNLRRRTCLFAQLPTRLRDPGNLAPQGQISECKRQSPNLRRYPRARPHILQRLCCRVENLSFFFVLAICDVLAIVSLSLFAIRFSQNL